MCFDDNDPTPPNLSFLLLSSPLTPLPLSFKILFGGRHPSVLALANCLPPLLR